MKGKLNKWLDILIETINYLVFTYALSNMAMLFQRNLFYILFLLLNCGLPQHSGKD